MTDTESLDTAPRLFISREDNWIVLHEYAPMLPANKQNCIYISKNQAPEIIKKLEEMIDGNNEI